MVDQVKEGIEAVAIEWWEQHKPHVERLMKSTNLAYAPSKSDIRNPALWTGAHWNWFLKNKSKVSKND